MATVVDGRQVTLNLNAAAVDQVWVPQRDDFNPACSVARITDHSSLFADGRRAADLVHREHCSRIGMRNTEREVVHYPVLLAASGLGGLGSTT
jgi:hypothetical protein